MGDMAESWGMGGGALPGGGTDQGAARVGPAPEALPEALRRHHGHRGAPRHHGVHHAHRSGGHHGHRHGGQGHAGRHRGGHPAHHHQRSGRATHALTERGTVSSYDSPTNTAMVQLVGTLNRLIGPVAVSLGIPTAGLAGKNCLVALLDAHNPSDAVVVAAW